MDPLLPRQIGDRFAGIAKISDQPNDRIYSFPHFRFGSECINLIGLLWSCYSGEGSSN
jgi:hypothetical protein